MKSVKSIFNSLRTHVDREVLSVTDIANGRGHFRADPGVIDIYSKVWYATRSNELILNGLTIIRAELKRMLENDIHI